MQRSKFPQVITVMGEALIDIIVDGEGEWLRGWGAP